MLLVFKSSTRKRNGTCCDYGYEQRYTYRMYSSSNKLPRLTRDIINRVYRYYKNQRNKLQKPSRDSYRPVGSYDYRSNESVSGKRIERNFKDKVRRGGLRNGGRCFNGTYKNSVGDVVEIRDSTNHNCLARMSKKKEYRSKYDTIWPHILTSLFFVVTEIYIPCNSLTFIYRSTSTT